MTIVIRSPKINDHSRTLTVDRVSHVASENHKVSIEQPVDEVYEDKQNSFDGNKGAELSASDKEPVKSETSDNYSEEIQERMSGVAKELAAVKSELEELKASLEERKVQAEKDGYDFGYQKGVEDSESILMQKLESFAELSKSLESSRESLINDSEEILVEIVFTAICKLVGEIMQTKDGVVGVVRQTIKQLSNQEKLSIRVSEKDYEILRDEREKLLQYANGKSLEIVSDSHLKHGGCIVESTKGGLDGRMEIQLKKLLDTLVHTRANKASIGTGVHE